MHEFVQTITDGKEYQIDNRPYHGGLWRLYKRGDKFRVSDAPEEDFDYEEFETFDEALAFLLASIGGFKA